MKKTEKEIIHYDKLGNRLEINDVVAVPHFNQLIIARIIKLNAKMIKVKKFQPSTSRYNSSEHLKYPSDTVKIPEADAVMYILKNT